MIKGMLELPHIRGFNPIDPSIIDHSAKINS